MLIKTKSDSIFISLILNGKWYERIDTHTNMCVGIILHFRQDLTTHPLTLVKEYFSMVHLFILDQNTNTLHWVIVIKSRGMNIIIPSAYLLWCYISHSINCLKKITVRRKSNCSAISPSSSRQRVPNSYHKVMFG
jgi:hypothetical protein